MMETLDSNILVISKKGKVLGVSLCPGVEEITELIEDKVGSHVDPLLNDRFLSVLSTKENVNLQTLGFERDDIQQYCAIINRLILQENVLELYLCTGKNASTILRILLSVSMERQ